MAHADFKLSRIGLIMLGVADMARSVAFYRNKLGLAVKRESSEFAFLDGGGVTLCLSMPLAKFTGRGVGATEIVFSVDDVRAAHEALRAKGVAFTHDPRNVAGPMWAANFNDPDGHGLSVFGPERKT